MKKEDAPNIGAESPCCVGGTMTQSQEVDFPTICHLSTPVRDRKHLNCLNTHSPAILRLGCYQGLASEALPKSYHTQKTLQTQGRLALDDNSAEADKFSPRKV